MYIHIKLFAIYFSLKSGRCGNAAVILSIFEVWFLSDTDLFVDQVEIELQFGKNTSVTPSILITMKKDKKKTNYRITLGQREF